jgi:high affinity Mn2+ porin
MGVLRAVRCAMLSRKRRSFAWSSASGFGLLVLLAASALAADAPPLVRKAPPAGAAPFDWNGAYVGGHVAYGFGPVHNSVSDPAFLPLHGAFDTAFGGVQAGYNRLLNSGLLLGVEGDLTFTNHLVPNQITASRTDGPSVVTESPDLIGTLRGRVGYAFDRWIFYGTGGLAWSQARLVQSPGVPGPADDKALRLRAGWAVGAGVEFALAPYWAARLEYLYDRLDPVQATFPSGVTYRSTFEMQQVRIGLNRKLGAPEFFGPKDSGESSPSWLSNWPSEKDWNVHGQFTLIGQGYPTFHSPYLGPNSLSGLNQFRDTMSATAFVGIRPWQGGELYLNPEIMQGFGLSDVHGVAAFPNGEAQKSNFPYPRFNMARMYIRQTYGFGGEQETVADGPNQLAGKQDISRISVTVGKFAVPDFFDVNAYAGEPRTGFLNWNMYGGGSYDWTMDRLSWTWGAMVELNQRYWAFRTGYFLLPAVSNSDNFDTNIPRRGEYVAELELRYALLSQPGKLRLFGWINHGTMGSYAAALALPPDSPDYPDIALTRRDRTNYGVVVNLEQAVTDDLGVFSRATWSPGKVEMVGWTDAHQSLSLGGLLKGTGWGRPNDKVALAGIVEGLSPIGRAYFAAGGLGILIGDGQLNYRTERVLETYYAYALNTWSTLTFDYQFFVNPGYNADRGPVSVFSLRYHAEW